MPNGDALNDQMEFIERIKSLPQEERSLEIARLTYTLVTKVDKLGTRFEECITSNGASKKVSATAGGLTAAIIIGIAEAVRALFGR